LYNVGSFQQWGKDEVKTSEKTVKASVQERWLRSPVGSLPWQGEDATRDDGVLAAAFEARAEKTTVEGKAAARLLLVCLVDIIARTMEDQRSRRKGRTNARFDAQSKLHNLIWLERKTRAIRETPYVTSGRMNP